MGEFNRRMYLLPCQKTSTGTRFLVTLQGGTYKLCQNRTNGIHHRTSRLSVDLLPQIVREVGVEGEGADRGLHVLCERRARLEAGVEHERPLNVLDRHLGGGRVAVEVSPVYCIGSHREAGDCRCVTRSVRAPRKV